jgi:effector-binding domain-containing protein
MFGKDFPISLVKTSIRDFVAIIIQSRKFISIRHSTIFSTVEQLLRRLDIHISLVEHHLLQG